MRKLIIKLVNAKSVREFANSLISQTHCNIYIVLVWLLDFDLKQDKYDSRYHIPCLEKCILTNSVKLFTMFNIRYSPGEPQAFLYMYAYCITLNTNTYFVSVNKDSMHGMLKYWWLRNSSINSRNGPTYPSLFVCVQVSHWSGGTSAVFWAWRSDGPWNRNLWCATLFRQDIRVSLLVSLAY